MAFYWEKSVSLTDFCFQKGWRVKFLLLYLGQFASLLGGLIKKDGELFMGCRIRIYQLAVFISEAQRYLSFFIDKISMQGPQNLIFTPNPNDPYKIISVLDFQKAFTLRDNDKRLTISDYKGTPNQIFNIYQNNQKYAFVNPITNAALHVEAENQKDGGVVRTDPGQHESSFFHISPVTKGEWAGKACHINTFAQGQSLDIKGGKCNAGIEICQWKFHGSNNQQWLIIPADNIQEGGKFEPVVEEQIEEVPAKFQPQPKTSYKVVSVIDEQKCLSVKDNKIEIGTFSGDKSQIFDIHCEQDKYAFVCTGNNSGLCIFEDKQDNGVQIVTDAARHTSSWFTLARPEKGKWTNKAYLIKTLAGNKAFDIAGGKAEDGKKVLQYNIHSNENQLWWIEAIENEEVKEEQKKGGKDNKGKNNKKRAPKRPKKEPKKPELPDVSPQVEVDEKSLFKIYSILNKNFVFTVDKDGKLVLNKHHNKPDQHFHVLSQGGKLAFADKKSTHALCIFQDKADANAQIITDAGKHNSSWFEVIRVSNGPFANKGYLIKTLAGLAMSVHGDKDDKTIVQAPLKGDGDQVWIIEPLNAGKKPKKEPFNNWQNEIEDAHQMAPPVSKGTTSGMGFAQNSLFKPEQNYIIYAINGGMTKSIDIAQDFLNYGSCIMFSFHGAPNQRFVFEQEGAMVRIRNVKDGTYLNVTHDVPNDNMWLRCDEKGHGQSELWTIVPATDPKYAGKNAYHIRSIFGKALTSPKSSVENGTHIVQDTFRCEDGQTWIIKQI